MGEEALLSEAIIVTTSIESNHHRVTSSGKFQTCCTNATSLKDARSRFSRCFPFDTIS